MNWLGEIYRATEFSGAAEAPGISMPRLLQRTLRLLAELMPAPRRLTNRGRSWNNNQIKVLCT